MTVPRGSVIAASASAGKAEIGHEQTPVVVEQKVGRLDVPMDEATSMGIGKPVGSFGSDRRRLLRAKEKPRVEQGTQAPPTEVLEHEIRNSFLVAPVVDVQDVAVVERGGEPRLRLELAEEGRVARQTGMKELDCDAPRKPRVVRGKDLGRSTGTDHGQQSVTAADDSADLFHNA